MVLRVLSACAAGALLTACGGNDETDDPAASSTPATSAAAPSAADPSQAGSAFCTESRELLEGLGSAFSDQADAAAVRGAFEQAAEGFRAVEPPAAIEEDWTTLGDGLADYAAAFGELDESDPESVAAFQQRTGALQGELTGAATSVESYLVAECGLTDTPSGASTGSAAPSS
jgi:hypothetical protein